MVKRPKDPLVGYFAHWALIGFLLFGLPGIIAGIVWHLLRAHG
jgi:hypothetical protein